MRRPGTVSSASDVLFALTVCGPSTPAALARVTGRAEGNVEAAVDQLRDAQLVAAAVAPAGAVALTPAGRAAADREIERERRALGEELSRLYPRFEPLDRALKDAVTRWQLRSVGGVAVANDHRDPGHDAAVLDDLADLCASAVAWLEPLASRRRRYLCYADRLQGALRRVLAGEHGWISGLGVDSLHSIWWQLHADLLAVLGRGRSGEGVV